MPHRIDCDSQTKYVYCFVSGITTHNALAKAFMETSDIAKMLNYSSVIIDLRKAEMKNTITNIYQTIKNFESFGFTKWHNLAIIKNNDHERNSFAETVLYNLGWSNVKLLSNPSEAIEWIKSIRNGPQMPQSPLQPPGVNGSA